MYKPIHNDGDVVINNSDNDSDSHIDDDSDNSSVYSDDSMSTIDNRARGLNNNIANKNNDKYHNISYKAQDRDLSSVDGEFYNVPDVTQNNTNRYTGIDESDMNNANIDIKNNKGTENDKYDLNGFLPQEEEKDWFETIETVDVKNSHLINIYKPIGVNTIGSCQKNATYDLRGTDKAVCPKFVVSPWMQSSIEPDRSMKSLC
jgi:hypothetical protein